MQEGTFFGNIIDTGPLTSTGKSQVNGPAAYYCDGANFTPGSTGVVAGRLGANQSGAPYKNPFNNLCQNVKGYGNVYVNSGQEQYGGVSNSCPPGTDMSKVDPNVGCPDGYAALQYPYATYPGQTQVPWNYGITVWRNANYTPQFDTSYQYMMSALVTGGSMVVDTGSSPIQQWNASAGLATSYFNFAASGSSWTISPMNGATSCLDAGAAINGTGIVAAACNGGASQKWNVTSNAQNGSFNIMSASTGRCMTVRGNSSSAGAVMETDDCVSGSSSQQFSIQASIYSASSGG
jgi:hypothetical protein